MQTEEGNEFMVGFGFGSVGIAVNPPPISDGLSPIPYMDLTPEEAEYLGRLLIQNARLSRACAKQVKHHSCVFQNLLTIRSNPS